VNDAKAIVPFSTGTVKAFPLPNHIRDSFKELSFIDLQTTTISIILFARPSYTTT
jgi:hypothetical protein